MPMVLPPIRNWVISQLFSPNRIIMHTYLNPRYNIDAYGVASTPQLGYFSVVNLLKNNLVVTIIHVASSYPIEATLSGFTLKK